MPDSELSPIEKIRQAKTEKARQEAEATAKLEAEKAATEAKEARRGELSFEREQVAANKEATEQAASTAKSEADEARAIQAEMGADIDADTAAAFEAVFAAETKANAELEKLNADLSRIDGEIQTIESGIVAEASDEEKTDTAEAEAEKNKEPSMDIEQVKKHVAQYDLETQHPYEGRGAQDFLNEIEESTVESLADMTPDAFELLRFTAEETIKRFSKSVKAYQAINIRGNLKDAGVLINARNGKAKEVAA